MNSKDDFSVLLRKSMLVPLVLLIAMWGVYAWEYFWQVSFISYGINPRDFLGLRGMFLSPFIHGDIDHLISNSFPVLILGTAIYYFYSRSANYVIFYSFLMTGLWVWALARPSFHIGASGLVYAWGAFLFTSGIINKNKRMVGISLLVVFLYGSLLWGIFPLLPSVSWESHLFGAIAGLVLAFVFQPEDLQHQKYKWEDIDEEYEIEFWNMTIEELKVYNAKKQIKKSEQNEVSIRYQQQSKTNS